MCLSHCARFSTTCSFSPLPCFATNTSEPLNQQPQCQLRADYAAGPISPLPIQHRQRSPFLLPAEFPYSGARIADLGPESRAKSQAIHRSSSREIWAKVYSNRDDVEERPLLDEGDPITKRPEWEDVRGRATVDMRLKLVRMGGGCLKRGLGPLSSSSSA